MKIFLTGASGFLGSHIARRLLADGHRVRALVLPGDPAPGLEGLDVERVEGDLLAPVNLAASIAGCSAVVHAAGKVVMRARGRELQRRLHAGALPALLAAAQAAGINRFVLVSSAGVLGALDQPGYLDETHAASGPSVFSHTYHHAKWLAEKIFFEFESPSMDKIAVLPTMLWGPGDWKLSSTGYALRALRGETIYYPVRGGTNILDAADAAAGVAAALRAGRPGERYVLAGENITAEAMCRAIAAAAGNGVRVKPVSLAMIYSLGFAAEMLGRCGIDIDFSLDIARQSGNYWWVSGAKAGRELGFTAKVKAGEAIARSVAWLRANQSRWPKP